MGVDRIPVRRGERPVGFLIPSCPQRPPFFHPMRLFSLTLTTSIALASQGLAQFGDAWVEFQPDPSRISGATVSDPQNETDLAWGDLDQDGRVDLVVARVQPIMGGGNRTNLLLMNEGGVLTDRTALYASASDVAGDQGFLTPTSDRDVEVADFNGDGWLDVVTAVGFGLTSETKAVSHPRIYINLGNDINGNWQGLRFEGARTPDLINFVSGNQVAARFNAVAVGDVDGDGDLDLYFGDHDASPTSPFGGEPPTLDTDDRLFINDGNGFFTDGTMGAVTLQIVNSNFSNAAVIADMNGDGVDDILKQTNSNARIEVAYNQLGAAGNFSSLQTVYTGSPYFASTGDLNDDGRLDVIVSENGLDGVVYNTGNDASGEINWSNLVPFDFISGSDDSFAANSLATDLDGDGLQDVLIADVDPQITGFNRRLHVYHNRGVQPTSAALLREERETPGAGWVGFVGATAADLNGTHDIAVFDVDGDKLDDIVISRNSGTLVWIREPVCQTDLGFGTPGFELDVCGNALVTGATSTIRFSGGQPNGIAVLAVSAQVFPVFIPLINATVVALPPILAPTVPLDGSGSFELEIEGTIAPTSLVLQVVASNGLPTLFSPSNAVQVDFLGG